MKLSHSTRVAATALAGALLVLTTIAITAGADTSKEGRRSMIKVGDKAPDVTFTNPEPGKGESASVRLSDFRGKKNVLLAFYPKAFTPDCTKQMCGYRDSIDAFRKANTEVIGISLDNPRKSAAFKKEHGLPFLVIADPDRVITNAFGVPVTNLLVVRFTKRCVFLIDKEGVVNYVNGSYNVSRDAAPLLEQIRQLNARETAR